MRLYDYVNIHKLNKFLSLSHGILGIVGQINGMIRGEGATQIQLTT